MSPKYGKFDFLIDEEDIEMCKPYTWVLHQYAHKSGTEYFYGQQAKCKSGGGVLLQRFLMSEPKGLVVDHINHNTLDNRRSNLRVCENRENIRNAKLLNTNTTSGYKGVTWDKHSRKWMANIRVDYHKKTLGYFNTPEEAAKCRQAAELKYFGEYTPLYRNATQ